jgi:hypothetical protein
MIRGAFSGESNCNSCRAWPDTKCCPEVLAKIRTSPNPLIKRNKRVPILPAPIIPTVISQIRRPKIRSHYPACILRFEICTERRRVNIMVKASSATAVAGALVDSHISNYYLPIKYCKNNIYAFSRRL